MKPYYEDGAVTIYHGDALAVLPTIGPVDAVVTENNCLTGITTGCILWA